MQPIEPLVDYIARWLVDEPDAIEITTEEDDDRVVLVLQVDENDMGRIIGREGRLATALRTLLSVAGHARGQEASLEIR